MNDGPATNLPIGTVVAFDDVAWIKVGRDRDYPWNDTNEGRCGNNYIDAMLERGAQMLRHGKES